MSYQLNKTDGALLTELIDGQIDQTSTNLTLVGRNYTGYGEHFNENFIKLLENFSSTAAPSNPLTGQVWYDQSSQRLSVYDGTVWKASGGPYVQDTQPSLISGDLWIDNLKNQLFAYDGTDLILVGPSYTQAQGTSGFQIESILDSQSRSRTVASLYVGGERTAILSALTFTPVYSQRIEALITSDNPNGIIYEGINVIKPDTFKFFGTASGANALITGTGVTRTADQFLPSDANGVTVGTLTVQNSGGITVGLSQNHVQKVVGPRFYFENQLLDHDLSLRVRTTPAGALIVDALYIDASEEKIGIFTNTPQYTLDVNGTMRVTGDLVVEGNSTTVETTTLLVEDKNIDLAHVNGGVYGDDSAVDGAGLTVLASTSNKTLEWKTATNAWTSNVNFDIDNTGNSYKIGGVSKLLDETLGSTVVYARGLTQLGQLDYLNVGSLFITQINNNTLQSSTALNLTANAVDSDGRGINITAAGDIHITDLQKITGMANPTAIQDAATKFYVDDQIATETIVFSMDITGLGSGATLYDNVKVFLNDLYPAATLNSGKVAKIHATSYAGATVSGISITVSENNTGVLQKSFQQVDYADGSQGPVIRDVVSNTTASGSAILTPSRQILVFTSDGTDWDFTSDTLYP